MNMALLRNISKILRTVPFALSSSTSIPSKGCFRSAAALPKSLHTSSPKFDLSEFFDDRKNWGEEHVKVGRPWKLDELRIKSNEDLHKLWYVLLKERNMLMTMEAEYKRECELFPNPERIFKVEESMENILEVVKERDRTYNLLETGTTGEPPKVRVINFWGLRYTRTVQEHLIPMFMNKGYRLTHGPRHLNRTTLHYIRLYREKLLRRRYKLQLMKAEWQKKMQDIFPNYKPPPEDKAEAEAFEKKIEEILPSSNLPHENILKVPRK